MEKKSTHQSPNPFSNRMLVAFTLKICQPFKLSIAVMFFVVICWSISQSLRPYLLKKIIDGIDSTLPGELWNSVGIWTAAFLGIAFIFPLLFRLYEYFVNVILTPLVRQNISNMSFEALLQHSYGYYQNNFAGSLSNKVGDLATSIPDIIQLVIQSFFMRTLAVLIAIYTLWQINPLFGIVILIWSIIHLLITLYCVPHFIDLSDTLSEQTSSMYGKLVDSLTSFISVQLFSRRSEEISLFDSSVQETVTAHQKLEWTYMSVFACFDYLYVLAQVISLYILFMGRMEGWVTLGDLVAVISINSVIIDLLFQLTKDFSAFAKLWGKAKQALRTLSDKPEIQDKHNAKSLVITHGRIHFDNIEFQYKGSAPLYKKGSVVIMPGQKVGLVGYSGGGKTTFVNLLLRLFELSSGRILIDGQNIQEITQETLRAAMAMIPQDPALFHRSLMENIRYGRLEASDDDVIEASKLAHAHEFIDVLPNGYHTLIGERGVKLSGGQRQRIAIARAILKNAPILILDEATSQLDSVTESEIQESLWKLMESKTTLVIAHRLSTLLHMDRILVVDQGTIVQDGTHQALLSQEGLYKILWENQVLKRYQQRQDYLNTHQGEA